MEEKSSSFIKTKKLEFIFNAIEDGWTVYKKDDKYIFSKSHKNEVEVFKDSYLNEFILKYISKGK